MTVPDRYDASWIPGPDRLEMDAGLELGYAWLEVSAYPGERVVVVATKSMLRNSPMLARAARYHVVSPRARDIPYATAGAVLAIWPSAETLELAQMRRWTRRCARSRIGTTSAGGLRVPAR